MDAALLREREAFKKRAMALPTVENKKARMDPPPIDKKKAAKGAQSQSAKAKSDLAQLRSSAGTGFNSQFKFGVLAKVVRYMKARHMDGDDHPLNLEEILEETHQTDVGSKIKTWLQNEALQNNPKLFVSDGGAKFIYNPPYKLPTRKALFNLLRRHDAKGMGGVFLEDVQESLPNCDAGVQRLLEEKKIMMVQRGADKKKVLFFHDHTADFNVDEDFQKLWRSVAVDMDEQKIDEYLEKQGIRSMQDQGGRKLIAKRQRKKPSKRANRGMKDNAHMGNVLQDYTEMTADKGDK